MPKYSQGKYQIRNPEKYIGKKSPTYRSSWELTFMMFCDNNPAILQWASEAIQIPYRNPFTNKNTIYVPDFLIIDMYKFGKRHGEIIEVKPSKETMIESAKSMRDKAMIALNMCKWEAAQKFCAIKGLKFRVVNETDIFHGQKR